jgi:hypothetical protein
MTTIKVDIIQKKQERPISVCVCVCVCTHLRGKESRRNLDGSDISILYIILYMHFTIKPQMHLQTLDNNLQLHSQKRRDISKQH